MNPPRLSAEGTRLAAAQAMLAPGTCAHALTEALHGTASELRPVTGTPRVEVTFAARLHPRLIAEAYAALGVVLTIQSATVGDGSRVFVRELEDGREYWFQLKAGDCPSGCSTGRHFWWRVVAGEAELLGEWGNQLGAQDHGGTYDTFQGVLFDPATFACRKCVDGRATHVNVDECYEMGETCPLVACE